MVTIVEHCDAANSAAGAIRMADVPMPIKLVVHGPKHEIKATIMKDVVKPPFVYTGPVALPNPSGPRERFGDT